MRIVAFLTDSPTVQAILRHLELPQRPPPLAPAAGFASLDLKQLEALLQAYDLRILYAAIGWSLERYQEHFFVPDEFLVRLERERPASPHYLPRRQRQEGGGGRVVPRWNLIVPETILRGAEPDEA